MNNQLYHHGIKGMKWGVRRTPAQLGHNPSSMKNNKKSLSDDKKKEDHAKKSLSDMSDDELRRKISRLKMEREYRELSSQTSQRQINRGKKFVTDILEKSGKNIGEQLTTYAMGTAVNKAAGQTIVNPKKGQKDK